MHYTHLTEWFFNKWKTIPLDYVNVVEMLALKDLSSKDTEVSTEISEMDTMNYIMMACLNYQVGM